MWVSVFLFTFTVDIMCKSGCFSGMSIQKLFKQHHTSTRRQHINQTQVSLFQLFTSVSLTQCRPVRKSNACADLGLPQLSLIFHTSVQSRVGGCTLSGEVIAHSETLQPFTSEIFAINTLENQSEPNKYRLHLKEIICRAAEC